MTEQTDGERTRGLFIVGLLVVLVAVRWTVNVEVDLELFWFGLILSWAVYCFCMIFACSDLPSFLVTFFKDLSWVFMRFSLILSIGFFTVVFIYVALYSLFGVIFYVLIAIPMVVIAMLILRKKRGEAGR